MLGPKQTCPCVPDHAHVSCRGLGVSPGRCARGQVGKERCLPKKECRCSSARDDLLLEEGPPPPARPCRRGVIRRLPKESVLSRRRFSASETISFPRDSVLRKGASPSRASPGRRCRTLPLSKHDPRPLLCRKRQSVAPAPSRRPPP